ncbi:MAG: oligopeptide transporter, OPT family [Candidatus Eiseniibacteriota bacterium]|jgi:putative OPT family oligopeptide transporter
MDDRPTTPATGRRGIPTPGTDLPVTDATLAGHPPPYISPDVTVPEITVRAVILGLLLSIIMGAANTYLGLRVGMTVSASIPAAVISMGILRGILKRGSILENNIVQTMASTGESLAAGAIFTVPAILMVGAWQEFRFWPTTLIVMLGGLLGVVFMVPMRRALIVNRPDLRYPEGIACSEVLVVGEEGGQGMRSVASGIGIGALFGLLLRGVQVILSTVEGAIAAGRSVLYFGADMSAALVGVGYIVGLEIAVLITIGGAIGWLVAMPLLGGAGGGREPLDLAWEIWDTKIRYIGVGTMLVGGVHSILSVRRGLVEGLAALGRSRRAANGAGRGDAGAAGGAGGAGAAGGAGGAAAAGGDSRPRTDQDLPLPALGLIFIVTVLGTFGLYEFLTRGLEISVAATVAMILTAFLFVAVATYIAGLVGSSNSPVSGMTICALLITAGVLLALGIAAELAIVATLGVAGVVCCAACTSGDIAQDLKTGLLVGATPRRQQSMELLATVVTAFFFAPILTLLHHAYGIGTGEPGSLAAPQAGLFASLTQGLFGRGEIAWEMVQVGIGVGIALLVLDRILAVQGVRFRLHIMPIAVGIYLPFSLDVPILAGGLVRFFTGRRGGGARSAARDQGVLFGSGLIAGEALMNIVLAIVIAAGVGLPFVVPDVLGLRTVIDTGWASILLAAGLVLLYVRMARLRG